LENQTPEKRTIRSSNSLEAAGPCPDFLSNSVAHQTSHLSKPLPKHFEQQGRDTLPKVPSEDRLHFMDQTYFREPVALPALVVQSYPP
jgi:hypothetical protein